MLQTIRLGNDNDFVKVAKYLMKYSVRNEASSIFDTDFFNYVSIWQGNNGLDTDGIIGKNTWTKMAELAPTCSTSKNKTSPYTCAIQILVGGLDVDGIYGTKTKNAVAAYQTSNGLGVDGICGPKTWKMIICGKENSSSGQTGGNPSGAGTTISGGKLLNKCVHYVQWNSKWKNVVYSTHTSSQTSGNSGCGPTAMADIMATWVDQKITPVEMCKLSKDNGYRTYNSGTSWGFFKFVFEKYPQFSKFLQTSSVETLKSALGQGALAVCSMNSNDGSFWTTSGYQNGLL